MDDAVVVDQMRHDGVVDGDGGVADVAVLGHSGAPVMSNVVVDDDSVEVVVDEWTHTVGHYDYTLLDHEVLGPPNILLFDPWCCSLGTYKYTR